MNLRVSRGLRGLTLAVILVVAIFTAITPPVSASAVQLYKETYPDASASYTLGQTIEYLCKVTCPSDAVNDLGPADVWDQLPNGTWIQLDHNLYLNKTAHKNYSVYYVVTQADVDAGSVTNHLNVSGKDMGGQNVTASVDETSTIEALPPNFDFTFEHTCCLNMTFTGSASDPANITNHTWNFGPGEGSIGPTSGAPGVVSHVFSSCGNKTVTLSGYNNGGKFNSTNKTVYVPCGPTVVASASKSSVIAGQGQSVTFSCAGSVVEPGLTPTYEWTFSDSQTGSSDNQCTTTRVIDGEPGESICATLLINDSHCEANSTVCVRIRSEEVPIFTPLGMVGLIAVLSALALLKIKIRRR
jgi:hypothetical protein